MTLKSMSAEKENIIGSTGNVNFKIIAKTLTNPFKEHFPAYVEGLVRGEPGGFVSSPEYARHAEEIRNFQPRNDDVWVLTFPKSGTTWTQEMVWMLMNNCDDEAAKELLHKRSPFLDLTPSGPEFAEQQLNKLNSLELIENMPSPRIIKSHLPIYLLNPKLLDTCKVVYVARNPKDVIVSFLYHHRLMKFMTFTSDLETFAQYFMDDEIMRTPFFPHVLEAWALRHHPNMLFIFYEDGKRDLRGQIERIASFLGKKLSEKQLLKLTAHLQFENFSKNEAVNLEYCKQLGVMQQEGKFVRKGETGDWKNRFSPELNRRVDEWMEKNLAGSDLKFITELTM